MHSREITVIVTSRRKSQHGNKYWEKKRKGKLEIRKENREIEWQTCTNRLIPSLLLKVLLSTKCKVILLGTSHSGPFPSNWLISTTGFSLGDYTHWGKWFLPWSWSCDITWHNKLTFFLSLDNSCLTYLSPLFSLHGVSYHCDYHFNWGLFDHFV